MSDIDETSNSTGYECPYCGHHHVCDDWGYEYESEVIECDSCDKKFYATANHTVDFEATPDCELNGIEHDLVFYDKSSLDGYNSYFCDICNKCILKKVNSISDTVEKE